MSLAVIDWPHRVSRASHSRTPGRDPINSAASAHKSLSARRGSHADSAEQRARTGRWRPYAGTSFGDLAAWPMKKPQWSVARQARPTELIWRRIRSCVRTRRPAGSASNHRRSTRVRRFRGSRARARSVKSRTLNLLTRAPPIRRVDFQRRDSSWRVVAKQLRPRGVLARRRIPDPGTTDSMISSRRYCWVSRVEERAFRRALMPYGRRQHPRGQVACEEFSTASATL